jgi:hypothetical protein
MPFSATAGTTLGSDKGMDHSMPIPELLLVQGDITKPDDVAKISGRSAGALAA